MAIYTQIERRKNINLLKGIIKGLKQTTKEQLVAIAAINIGLSNRKVEEYLQILEEGGYIKQTNGKIEYVEETEKAIAENEVDKIFADILNKSNEQQ
jgi:DNA-binding transcriptional regulator YhcF (GntR family)